MQPDPTELNQRFPEPSLTFDKGEGGLTRCQVHNQWAQAEFYLQGAHLTRYQKHHSLPLLWLSHQAVYALNHPIRGGLPICWPWFNQHASGNPAFPQHGFARTHQWSLRAVLETDNGTEIFLGFTSTPATQRWLPGEFDARYRISVGPTLSVEFSVTNTGEHSLNEIGCALHTYFSISQINEVIVTGLEGLDYLDQLDGLKKNQRGALKFNQETDRIYLQTQPRAIQIKDTGNRQKLDIQSQGSHSTVIWNPWKHKSTVMPDFPDQGYQTMICIETANAFEDTRTIEPGATHSISQTIQSFEL
ncbi:MAG: D-hexose-6-phosphate mutarotase [Planctomycetota bacterium]|nr:D-hexose-6-phosphate mutarotase [Planctomycetota bacterium]